MKIEKKSYVLNVFSSKKIIIIMKSNVVEKM